MHLLDVKTTNIDLFFLFVLAVPGLEQKITNAISHLCASADHRHASPTFGLSPDEEFCRLNDELSRLCDGPTQGRVHQKARHMWSLLKRERGCKDAVERGCRVLGSLIHDVRKQSSGSSAAVPSGNWVNLNGHASTGPHPGDARDIRKQTSTPRPEDSRGVTTKSEVTYNSPKKKKTTWMLR